MRAQPAPGTPCVGYCRVSTERQADDVHTSIADQQAAIRTLALKLGASVTQWFRDEGASGATVTGRPEFLRLLEHCQANPCPTRTPGLVLVLNDSRFGRFDDPEEAAYWRHHLRRSGWIVRLAEGDESEDATARSIMRAIGSAQASEYRRNLIANTRRGMRGSANQGFWTREAPFGYRRRVVFPPGSDRILEPGQQKGGSEKVKLTPHEDEAKIVRWMFEAYASGTESLGTLADKLRVNAPGREWSRTVVQHTLRNEAYIGDVTGGRRGGNAEPYGMRDAHAAVVSRDLFERVQRRLKANKRTSHAPKTNYLLTGVMTCAYCGGTYRGGGGGKSKNKNPLRKFNRFYKDTGHNCPGPLGTVTQHLIDDAVISVVSKTLSTESVRGRIVAEIDRVLEGTVSTGSDSRARLQKRLADAEAKRDRLISAIAAGVVTAQEATAQLADIRRQVEMLTGQMEVARFDARRTSALTQQRDRLISAALDFPNTAARLSGPALRELVLPWIASATFDKGTRHLTLGIRMVAAGPAFLLYNSRAPDSP